MKTRTILLVLLAIAFLACKQPQKNKVTQSQIAKNEFIISGKVKGAFEGQLATLGNLDAETILDTVAIKEGSLTFKGKIEVPSKGIIRILDVKGEKIERYHTFYLENANYTFVADYENFKEARLEGSAVNDLYYQLVDARKNPVPGQDENPYFSNSGTMPTQDEIEAYKKRMVENQKIRFKADSSFLQNHLNSFPAIDILMGYANSLASAEKYRRNPTKSIPFGLEDVKEYYNQLSEPYKASYKGQALYAQLFKGNVEEGMPYVELEGVLTLDGKPFKVAELQTDYVLLDFTGVHCPPCKKFKRAIAPYYDEYKDKLTIVYVHVDSNKELIKEYVEKSQISGITVSDFRGKNSVNAKRYKVSGIPDFYLLDKERKVIKRTLGYEDEYLDYLLNKLNITKRG